MNKIIEGVKVNYLKVIPDERGRLAEIFRSDDPIFEKFGQVYFTTTYPGVVKAWHMHKIQTDNVCCISGMIKLVLYDDRKKSRTHNVINEIYMGKYNLVLVQIPPKIWHGWKCISENEAMIINVPTKIYNPYDEFRMDPHNNKLSYIWERKDG